MRKRSVSILRLGCCCALVAPSTGPAGAAAVSAADGAAGGGAGTFGVCWAVAASGDAAPFLTADGGGCLKKYGVTNITTPMRMKARRSRISIDSSFWGGLPGGLLPLFTESGIQEKFRLNRASPDGIEPAGMKGMASHQAAEAHPDASRGAISLDSLQHVLGAGRIKAARRWQPGRDTHFIYAKRADYDPLQRRKSFSTSVRSSAMGASKALRRGLKTMDHCGLSLSRWSRTTSRSRRRMRLRTT